MANQYSKFKYFIWVRFPKSAIHPREREVVVSRHGSVRAAKRGLVEAIRAYRTVGGVASLDIASCCTSGRGWDVITSGRGPEIQRCDECARFQDDDEAAKFAGKQGQQELKLEQGEESYRG